MEDGGGAESGLVRDEEERTDDQRAVPATFLGQHGTVSVGLVYPGGFVSDLYQKLITFNCRLS